MGLTGGVGSGKSTVSARLAELGAVVIDADAIAREVVEPGTPGLAAVVERFGSAVLGADGRLDRPAVAAIVFSDEAARADLNAIVHPLVGQRTGELMAAAADDAIVVYDVPLLVESNMAGGFEVVVVVEADPELRIQRLAGRGMAEADARARMAIQATDEQRRAVATELLENNGTRDELITAVDALWQRLVARSQSTPEA
ncbi:dephospho-CoA kinase [Jatrophihabitans sp.]|uniref:dephospho-CoA kinase n=1 Tax=Jatrophihabitans sp. TaxID=1932789 RepID=UPI0030C6A289|nr:dephospho-CoA kinase [Jatrophihabitans sp.]